MDPRLVGENTYAEIEYLKMQYRRLGLLDNNGQKTPNPTRFDFNKYPGEEYIPKCTNCCVRYAEIRDKIKKNQKLKSGVQYVELPHCNCRCLWTDYYKTKILNILPNARFVPSSEFYGVKYDTI